MKLTPPEPIGSHHALDDFASGSAVLDVWLRRRALANEQSGASRTFVVADAGTVRGFYTLSAACIARRDVSARIRRNMPEPIPAALLGRLAVDHRAQGLGVARGLVRDAALRTVSVSEIVGIRCLMVHALSPEAARFWAHLGFTASPLDPLLLAIKLSDLAEIPSR